MSSMYPQFKVLVCVLAALLAQATCLPSQADQQDSSLCACDTSIASGLCGNDLTQDSHVHLLTNLSALAKDPGSSPIHTQARSLFGSIMLTRATKPPTHAQVTNIILATDLAFPVVLIKLDHPHTFIRYGPNPGPWYCLNGTAPSSAGVSNYFLDSDGQLTAKPVWFYTVPAGTKLLVSVAKGVIDTWSAYPYEFQTLGGALQFYFIGPGAFPSPTLDVNAPQHPTILTSLTAIYGTVHH